ncbi:DUF924 family protein [Maricaulis parjimensis]|uniref:DUF924 family protein n=1 Tax=Maricaulis parjimensis TaxID=144023 RepID=UPI001939DC31|nr:DUF924 family protein [Maricaulis parjimensis]
MTPTPITADDILAFWFDEIEPKHWYQASHEFDAMVRRRFGKTIEAEARRYKEGDHPWLATAQGSLALILLFDQFSRNVWRGSNVAFSCDPLALDVARTLIERGLDWAIPDEHRAFVYMPFMHSEDLTDQELCVTYAEERLSDPSTARHARLHRDVIVRFGRFPYRNQALGRESTEGERVYLESGGYAPGQIESAKSS